LKIKNEKIICQRIQDISEEDCMKEGIQVHYDEHPFYGPVASNPKTDFKSLWDSINLKRGYGWSFNPWAWGLYYKVVKKEIR